MVIVMSLTPGSHIAPSTVQWSNIRPLIFRAVQVTSVPLSYHGPGGETFGRGLIPVGSVPHVRRYWVFQFQVMLEGLSIVKIMDVFVPDVGTLPVPVQPVHTYLVPVGPDTGEVIDALMDSPASNHPLIGMNDP